jgi:hypothetical protein
MLQINPAAKRVLKSFVVVQSGLRDPITRCLFDKSGKPYRTACPVSFQFGKVEILVPQGYAYDGPTIPRVFWFLTGFSPMDDELMLPSLLHDFCLTNPEDSLPRVMADGAFVTAMSVSVFNGKTIRGVPRWRRVPIYLAVRLWSCFQGWRGKSK